MNYIFLCYGMLASYGLVLCCVGNLCWKSYAYVFFLQYLNNNNVYVLIFLMFLLCCKGTIECNDELLSLGCTNITITFQLAFVLQLHSNQRSVKAQELFANKKENYNELCLFLAPLISSLSGGSSNKHQFDFSFHKQQAARVETTNTNFIFHQA